MNGPTGLTRASYRAIELYELAEEKRPADNSVRREITTDEWIDLMVRSMGYEPGEMSRRLGVLRFNRSAYATPNFIAHRRTVS